MACHLVGAKPLSESNDGIVNLTIRQKYGEIFITIHVFLAATKQL